jgi:hypothetical protein
MGHTIGDQTAWLLAKVKGQYILHPSILLRLFYAVCKRALKVKANELKI